MTARVRGALLAVALLAVLPSSRLAAQSEATVNGIAPILAAEDARNFDGQLFSAAVAGGDSLVRRTAIRALGHLRDPRGLDLLFQVLQDPDIADHHAEAAFAIGLIRDSSSVDPLIQWLRSSRALRPTAIDEGVTALAKIGGPVAAEFLTQLIRAPRTLGADTAGTGRKAAVREAWRLGPLIPAPALLALVDDTALVAPATYSLARVRSRDAGAWCVSALRSHDPVVRQNAARALSRNYVRDAGLDAGAVTAALRAALNDPDAGLRINALRALGSYADSALAPAAISLLADENANVQLTAATVLGQLGGAGSVAALQRGLEGRRSWAVRREALLSLARIDRAAFRGAVTPWATSPDWRDRAAAAEGASRISATELAPYLGDSDPRVVATALQGWASAVPGPDPELVAAARARLSARDPMVRSVGADILARAASGVDVTPLTEAWRRAAHDSFPDAAQSALAALRAIEQGPDGERVASFVASEPAPEDHLLKEWAEVNWPELAERWGPSWPIVTRRSLDDYRTIARRFIVGTADR